MVLAALLAAGEAEFASPKAKEAQKAYWKAIDRAKAEYEAKLGKARADYRKALEAALTALGHPRAQELGAAPGAGRRARCVAALSADPEGTSCGACHTRTYCDDCHATKVVQVPHDGMLTNHAAVIRDVGAATCTICHQVPSFSTA